MSCLSLWAISPGVRSRSRRRYQEVLCTSPLGAFRRSFPSSTCIAQRFYETISAIHLVKTFGRGHQQYLTELERRSHSSFRGAIAWNNHFMYLICKSCDQKFDSKENV
ncbi:hypothetical protein [Nostoc sp. UHCC 0251]|uniref:hypothetical protein n=1 Tax=Nostoc sp. UHCC 0251 TaxID=3110240 RepID=UPI002B1FA46F|nr:hypothetical protein [Nostoc sp. UHCC 0251]MEA5624348.1 hypothetical protein [Nostoc sp. UHCC 0251]